MLVIIISIVALVIAFLSAYYTRRTYDLNKLIGEEKLNPQLQVNIRAFNSNIPFENTAQTDIEVVNYSSFPTYDVWCDTKLGDADWIGDWCKTRMQDLEKKGNNRTPDEEAYLKSLKKNLAKKPKLKPRNSSYKNTVGSVPTNLSEIARIDNPFPIHLKVSWRNKKNGRVFEEIKKFGCYCIMVGDSERFHITTDE